MSKFRISVNNLILGYHGNITIATICSFLATCPFTKVPHTFLIPCVPAPPKAITGGGEGGSGGEREEGKDGGWRKRRRERVRECVYGQEREEGRLGGKGLGRVEEKDGGWRKEHSTWEGGG